MNPPMGPKKIMWNSSMQSSNVIVNKGLLDAYQRCFYLSKSLCLLIIKKILNKNKKKLKVSDAEQNSQKCTAITKNNDLLFKRKHHELQFGSAYN